MYTTSYSENLGGEVMKIFKKIILLTCSISLLFFIFSPSILATTNENIETKKIEFVNQYSGIDLNSKNFNRTQMTDKENKAYDELLEIMYLENMDIAISEGYSKTEYLQLAEDILSGNVTLSENLNSNSITYSATSTRASNDHGTISTQFLGGVLNGVIDSALLVAGAGSVSALIKKMGKEAAKEWIEKNVKQSIIKKLSELGLKEAGVLAGSIVGGIVDAYVDPGSWLAEQVDANDKIPSNGYIELW